MSLKKTNFVQFATDCTSGTNLSDDAYVEGMAYVPTVSDPGTSKDVPKIYYDQMKSAYRASTKSSREQDRIAGLNIRLKNINP